jgi:hypothetical protein
MRWNTWLRLLMVRLTANTFLAVRYITSYDKKVCAKSGKETGLILDLPYDPPTAFRMTTENVDDLFAPHPGLDDFFFAQSEFLAYYLACVQRPYKDLTQGSASPARQDESKINLDDLVFDP